MSPRSLLFWVLLVASAATAAAAVQNQNPCQLCPDQGYAPWVGFQTGDLLVRINLDLSHPGARSLGMGGAFAGLSDDSTAALTNPAALTQVLRPELALEIRRGAAGVDTVGATTIQLTPGAILTAVGPIEPLANHRSSTEPTFQAASYAGKRWVIAAYEHQLVKVEFPGAALDISGTGLSAAWRLTEAISLGATYARYRGKARVEDTIFSGGANPVPAIESRTTIDDAKSSFNVGVFVRPSQRWSLGAFYRQGVALEVAQEVLVFSTNSINSFAGNPLELPDSWGLGLGYRPTESLLLDLDWTRTRHTRHRQVAGSGGVLSDESQTLDVDRLALGAEYSFWSLATAPALRLGVSTEPDPLPSLPGTPAAPKNRLFFSAGAGVVFASHWQLDIAVQNIGRSEPSVALSTLVRF